MSWLKSQIGYCSNVHAGETPRLIEENINRFTGPLRQCRDITTMQHGLWMSQKACADYLSDKNKLASLQQHINDHKISVVTLNAFPLGNFHALRVKQNVYRPHWGERARFDYTCQAAQLLVTLLPIGETCGTISTLPLGYAQEWTDKDHSQALEFLCEMVTFLVKLEGDSGKHIQLCLEMEPGCVLQETSQLVALFQKQLPSVAGQHGLTTGQLHRHLGVCFDICHQAVMYENIDASLQAILAAGITIGKIQISSALCVKNPTQPEVKSWLSEFAQSRYLHQVTGRTANGAIVFSDDLELALKDQRLCALDEWRIHFHVPVHESTMGHQWMATTSSDIQTVFKFLSENPACHPHLELETYSWNVLPEKHRPANDDGLIKGIYTELTFIEASLNQFNLLEEEN